MISELTTFKDHLPPLKYGLCVCVCCTCMEATGGCQGPCRQLSAILTSVFLADAGGHSTGYWVLGKHVVTEISPFSWIPQQSHYCPTHGMSTSSSSLLSSLGFSSATQNLTSLYNTLTPLSCGFLFLSLVNVSA